MSIKEKPLLGTKSSSSSKHQYEPARIAIWSEFLPLDGTEDVTIQFERKAEAADTSYIPITLDHDSKAKYLKSVFLGKIASALLTECTEKLLMLENKNKKFVERPSGDPTVYKDLKTRFGLPTTEQMKDFKINSETNDLTRIQEIIVLLVQLLESAYKEIDVTGNFRKFTNQMDNILTMQREENGVHTVTEDNRSLLALHKNLYKEEFKKLDTSRQQLAHSYKLVTNECENYIFNKSQEIDFLTNWENARIEQLGIIGKTKKKSFLKCMDDIAQKSVLENAAHECIERFYDISEEDMVNDLDIWSDRYDRDVEKLDLNINKFKIDIENAEIEYEEALKVFKQRQADINAWMAAKRDMKRKAEMEKRRNMLATKIQAWWKGTMVRLRLGTFDQFFKQLEKELKARRKAEQLAAKLAALN